MSNLIKASFIKYDEQFKTLDNNPRADAYEQEFVDKYIADNIALKQISFDEVSNQLEEDPSIADNFRPGLLGERISLSELSSEHEPEVDAEADDKRRELEELADQTEQLRAEADNILEEARAEAERILEEARERAEAERQDIIAQAHEDGYNAGMEEARAANEELRAELESRIAENQAEYEKQVEELEPAFTELIIKYVNKLTGVYAEDKREIILYLLDSAMKGRQLSGNILIRVSPEDLATVREAHDDIALKLGEDATHEVIEDKLLEKGHCIIETESRIFDCDLGTDLQGLTEDLLLLAEKE